MEPLDSISTQAGKVLWSKVNAQHGSSTWGYVGEGIQEIEYELRKNIADKILEDHLVDFSSPKGVSNHCLRGDCDHEKAARIARGNDN